jgi:beta-glucosidase
MSRQVLSALTVAGLFTGVASQAIAAPPPAPARPWMDRGLSAGQRAELLNAQLTVEERLALVHGVFPPGLKPLPEGMLLSAGFVPGVPRLGIPPLTESDASLGVAAAGRKNDDATALPSSLSLAASFDPAIGYAGGAMIGKEARQKGFNVLLAGGINLVRDPRNGRNFEYVGEDVLLAGVMAGASITGVQSNHLVSTIKHFVLNGQETGRMALDARIESAALRESDLLAFEIAIETGQPGSVMCAYNRINGPYACENPATLGALKGDWGWKGWVMSDWGAVHSTAPAIQSGVDQESGEQLDKQVFFGPALREALAAGQVPAARLEDMTRRILWGLFSTGVMDDPLSAGGLNTAEDGAVAERAAEAGLVLLKNAGGLLPLARAGQRLAVIGGRADLGVLSGGGSSQVIPSGSHVYPIPAGAPSWTAGVVYHPSAPLAAIEARAGAQVAFFSGEELAAAVAGAKAADVAVVFATQWATEGVDVSLTLQDHQDELIAAVAAANPRTIVVLETGGAVLMPWLAQVPAVLEAWYPGGRGGEAIARLLFGEIDAEGRLPISFPSSEAQLPRPELPGAGPPSPTGLYATRAPGSFPVEYLEGADVGYRWFEKQGLTPAFAFGHGLSYTRFRYSGLKVTGGQHLRVSFEVTNVGTRAGVETPQVYAAGAGHTRRLIGFHKLALKPQEKRRVEVEADPRLLARFDAAKPGWVLAPGRYAVTVGPEAAMVSLEGAATLEAQRLKP